MLGDGIFGILLHSRINGRIDFQSVCIEIVMRTVFLDILLAPAIEGIGFPVERVLVILLHLPSPIVATVRLLGCQYPTQVFPEVGGLSFVMVYPMVLQSKRQGLQRVTLTLADVRGLTHLVKHDVAASAYPIGPAHRVVERRVLAHTHQCSRLFGFQVARQASEVSKCGSLDADGIVQEVELVEIHRQYLLFGIITLQLDGNHPLDRFLEKTFHDVAGTG